MRRKNIGIIIVFCYYITGLLRWPSTSAILLRWHWRNGMLHTITKCVPVFRIAQNIWSLSITISILVYIYRAATFSRFFFHTVCRPQTNSSDPRPDSNRQALGLAVSQSASQSVTAADTQRTHSTNNSSGKSIKLRCTMYGNKKTSFSAQNFCRCVPDWGVCIGFMTRPAAAVVSLQCSLRRCGGWTGPHAHTDTKCHGLD